MNTFPLDTAAIHVYFVEIHGLLVMVTVTERPLTPSLRFDPLHDLSGLPKIVKSTPLYVTLTPMVGISAGGGVGSARHGAGAGGSHVVESPLVLEYCIVAYDGPEAVIPGVWRQVSDPGYVSDVDGVFHLPPGIVTVSVRARRGRLSSAGSASISLDVQGKQHFNAVAKVQFAGVVRSEYMQ